MAAPRYSEAAFRIAELEISLQEARRHISDLLREWTPISEATIRRDAREWLEATTPPSDEWEPL